MVFEGYRSARRNAYRTVIEWNWQTKTLVAAGFAGLLALLSQVAIPVPWTPVPLTLQLLGVFLIGTYLGPRYALVSFGIYLAAGAIGLHVFAPSSNSFNPPDLYAPERWRILVPDAVHKTGFTMGYIVGWVLAGAFIALWMRRRSARLDGPFLWAIVLGLGALLASITLGSLYLDDGNHFSVAEGSGTQYDSSHDKLLVFAAASLVLVPAMAWLVARGRGGSEALNLYLVLMAGVAIIHVCGLIVLKATLDLTWQQAAGLGSTVFLPFDALKAGLAVVLALPFLPSRRELDADPPATPG